MTQRCVTTSTCWAELVAMSLAAAEVVYCRALLESIGLGPTAPTELAVRLLVAIPRPEVGRLARRALRAACVA